LTNILLWIDYGFLYFGISKYLQQKNFKVSAIIDGMSSTKNFFETQKLIKFEKIWNFENNASDNIDYEYLKNFEKKYSINLWEIIFSDRYFYNKFNKYHKFNKNELLSILQNECKLFENILSEKKFDFVFMNTITHHYQQLFYKMCSSLGITVLTLEPTRFGSKWIVITGSIYDWIPKPSPSSVELNFQTYDDIQNFLEENRPAKYFHEQSNVSNKKSRFAKLHAMLEFTYSTPSFPVKYTEYGRSKKNVLLKGMAIQHSRLRNKRQSFIDKNFVSHISNFSNIVYFPLHLEPERVLLLGAPYYANQISVIENICKCLPVDYTLFVKEHPAQYYEGWRNIEFYEKIMDLPNVELIHPSLNSDYIIENSSLVISIRGTASLEAALKGKPSIVLKPDIGHSLVSSVYALETWDELPKLIRNSLQTKCSPKDIVPYFSFIYENAFDFPNEYYSDELANHFSYNLGYLKQPEIDDDNMNIFLEKFDNLYETLANEFIKKIQEP
jgi:hypothetical protein